MLYECWLTYCIVLFLKSGSWGEGGGGGGGGQGERIPL